MFVSSRTSQRLSDCNAAWRIWVLANGSILRYRRARCRCHCRKGLVVKALRAAGYRNVHAHVGFDARVEAGNTFWNFLGESRLVKLHDATAADFAPDYFQPK